MAPIRPARTRRRSTTPGRPAQPNSAQPRITATNGAGLTATDSLTISADSTAPTGQTATLTTGPWYTSASVGLTLGNGSDSESGVDTSSGVVERSSATLTSGTCGRFGSWSTVTLTGGADTTVTTGNCYRYRYTITDNVGNQSSASSPSANAKVDTTAPAVANAAPTAISGGGNQHYDSGTETLYFRPAGSGSFQLNATASDGQSDIASVAFPDLSALNGFSGSGGSDSSSPYASTAYSWTAGAGGNPGGKTVTATNGAGGTGTTTITITPDSTAPTGQTAALSGGPYYSSTSVPLTLGNGSDTGAGVDSSSGVVERASATLTGGTLRQLRLLVGGDARRRRRHHGHQRQLLPLPLHISDLVGNASNPSDGQR